MKNLQQSEQLEALQGIRNLMERTSRYLPLSGKAGVIIGSLSIVCSLVVDAYISVNLENLTQLLFLFGSLFLVSLLIEIVMAEQNARRKKVPAWDAIAKRFLINLFIPLFAGGVYAFALLQQQQFNMVLPATLVFYGLALVNASRYTIEEIRYLGMVELLLGLLSSCFTDYGLLAWGLGFGVLHVVYGIIIYFKHEK